MKHKFSILYLSGRNEMGANESEKAFEKTKKYVWRQNKGYLEGTTC